MGEKEEKQRMLLNILAIKESIEKDMEKMGKKVPKKRKLPEKADDRLKQILIREKRERTSKPAKKVKVDLEDIKTFLDIPGAEFDINAFTREINTVYKEETAEKDNLLAISSALQENYDEALTFVRKAYEKKADPSFLLNKVEIMVMQGKLEEAVSEGLSFLKNYLDYPEGHLELAKILFQLGMKESTWLKLVHNYIQLEKNTFKKTYWKGIELLLRGNTYDALSILSSTLRFGKKTSLISNVIAYIRMSSGDFDEANRNLNIAKNGDFACIHCNLAKLDFLSNSVSMETLRHLHAQYPYCFSISKMLVREMILEDKYERAVEEVNELLELDIANDPEVLYLAGLTFYHFNDMNSADKMWKDLFERYPSTSVSLLYKHEIVKKQGIFGMRYLKSTNVDHSKYEQNFASTLKKLLPLFAKKNSYSEKNVDFAFHMPDYSTFYQSFAGGICKVGIERYHRKS